MHNEERVGGDRASIASVGQASRPLFTVFTPTNDPQFLRELYNSLRDQAGGETWEWRILFNCKDKPADFLREDERIHITQDPNAEGIGPLKNALCRRAKGVYLVEVDHDDWLHPEALREIRIAIEENDSPEFLYSDFTNVKPDGSCELYSPASGWTSYEHEVDGVPYQAHDAPPINARSLYQIFYAPNHVRVWQNEFYKKIGGHSHHMHICDDHDLLCRTYLAGARMIHIPLPLYFYRLRGDSNNTYLVKNAEIQKVQQEVGNRYFYDLVAEETRRRELVCVDLGGYSGSPDGYERLDRRAGSGVTVCDVLEGLPYEDDSVGIVRAVDFLEHIPAGEPVIALMQEIWRVLAPNGFLITSTPSTDGRGAFCDPTHISFWNQLSFRYYCDPNYMKYIPEFEGKFQQTRVWTNFPSDWHKDNLLSYVHADLMKVVPMV